MKDVKVILTMDCEPTLETTHSSATGPKDFAASERAIRGYFEIASSYGLPVTYFVHPETARAQADLFSELADGGACIGLHMHPWKYSQWRYDGEKYMAHFGQLTYDEQLALLSESATIWRDALGEVPMLFRPGTFSANDNTFRAMAELGFKGGSVSAPGRIFREIRAVWSGAEPDPHRADAEFRQLSGTMALANMPLSADFSRLLDLGNGRYRHADFRPDVDWPGQYGISYETIARNTLDQVIERQPAIPVLNSITHNHFNYDDRADPLTQRLLVMIDDICAACERKGIGIIGATVADVVDQVLALPPQPETFLFR